jgi:hypothetical protein
LIPRVLAGCDVGLPGGSVPGFYYLVYFTCNRFRIHKIKLNQVIVITRLHNGMESIKIGK